MVNVIEETPVGNMIGYHVSQHVFTQFDNSHLSDNTYQAGTKEAVYSVDSFLGYQFIEDAERLVNYTGRAEKLGTNLYEAEFTLRRIAAVDIAELRTEMKHPQQAQAFRDMLLHAGFDAVRITDPQNTIGSDRLAKDTLVILKDESIKIQKMTDLMNSREYHAADGSLCWRVEDWERGGRKPTVSTGNAHILRSAPWLSVTNSFNEEAAYIELYKLDTQKIDKIKRALDNSGIGYEEKNSSLNGGTQVLSVSAVDLLRVPQR